MTMPFNLIAIGQAGRLQYEALLLVASWHKTNPAFAGRFFICEPQPGPLWDHDPRLPKQVRDLLQEMGAEIIPFENRHFGQSYPHGNKIEALSAVPDQPFLFLDTDTLITGDLTRLDLDFTRPSASMRRENTWPKIELYGPDYHDIWGALYRRFDLDFDSAQDESQPLNYWQRYLYFNAGWFFHQSPQAFGARFLDYALSIRDAAPPELDLQELHPWLDQVALPLVIHSFGGGRPQTGAAGLDGDLTCHWRHLGLLYARESEQAVALLEELATTQPLRRVLRDYEPIRQLVLRNQGRKARALFDRNVLPKKEKALRTTLRREGLWFDR